MSRGAPAPTAPRPARGQAVRLTYDAVPAGWRGDRFGEAIAYDDDPAVDRL